MQATFQLESSFSTSKESTLQSHIFSVHIYLRTLLIENHNICVRFWVASWTVTSINEVSPNAKTTFKWKLKVIRVFYIMKIIFNSIYLEINKSHERSLLSGICHGLRLISIALRYYRNTCMVIEVHFLSQEDSMLTHPFSASRREMLDRYESTKNLKDLFDLVMFQIFAFDVSGQYNYL